MDVTLDATWGMSVKSQLKNRKVKFFSQQIKKTQVLLEKVCSLRDLKPGPLDLYRTRLTIRPPPPRPKNFLTFLHIEKLNIASLRKFHSVSNLTTAA